MSLWFWATHAMLVQHTFAAEFVYWLGQSNQGMPSCWQVAVGANTTCVAHFMEMHTAGSDLVTGLCPPAYILHDSEQTGCDGDVEITAWLADEAVSCKWAHEARAADLRSNGIGNGSGRGQDPYSNWDVNKSVIVLTGVPHCYEFRARNASACTQSWLDVHGYQVAQYCPGLCPPEFSVDIPLQSIADCPDVAFGRLGLANARECAHAAGEEPHAQPMSMVHTVDSLRGLAHVASVYEAVEAATAETVLVALWTGRPLPPPLDIATVGDVRVHWCDVHRSTDRDHDEDTSGDPTTVMQALEIMGWAGRVLDQGHSNTHSFALDYRAGRLTLMIGVTAKGFIPVGETPFPAEINVPMKDGSVVRLAIDVCRGWSEWL